MFCVVCFLGFVGNRRCAVSATTQTLATTKINAKDEWKGTTVIMRTITMAIKGKLNNKWFWGKRKREWERERERQTDTSKEYKVTNTNGVIC